MCTYRSFKAHFNTYLFRQGYTLEMNKLLLLLLLLLAVKRKDASLNKILTRRNRLVCNYHSLKYFVKYSDSQIILKTQKSMVKVLTCAVRTLKLRAMLRVLEMTAFRISSKILSALTPPSSLIR